MSTTEELRTSGNSNDNPLPVIGKKYLSRWIFIESNLREACIWHVLKTIF